MTSDFGRLTAQALRDEGINARWTELTGTEGIIVIYAVRTSHTDPLCEFPVDNFIDDTNGPEGAATRIMNKMWNARSRK